ncbi:MAG: serine hydrolase domain-containing protein [Bacteroidota bacterium]
MMKYLATFLLLTGPFYAFTQQFDTSKLGKFLDLVEENERGMGSLSIFKDGKEVYQKSIGYSSLSDRKKANEKTSYRIGSISKTFTASIIMQLIVEKRLSLETKLADYFPEIPNANSITIAYLLRHRSGIFNFTNSKDFADWMTTPQTKETLLSRIVSFRPVFEPNEKAEYSNSNYVLLSWIIEEIEKKPYPRVLNERIVSACQLNRTKYGGKIDAKQNEAFSYIKPDNWELSLESDMSIPQGAGGIVSSPTDLNKFLNCLFEGKVVSKDMVARMTQINDGFGLGMLQVPFYSKKAYGHTRGIDGFSSMAYFFPDEQVAVAYISNGTVMPVNDILIGVLSIYFGMDYDLPAFISVEKEILEKYEGIYGDSSFPLDISVFINGEQLMAQATNQAAFALEAVSENVFKFSPAGIIMTFTSEENQMIFEQMGAKHKLTKKYP